MLKIVEKRIVLNYNAYKINVPAKIVLNHINFGKICNKIKCSEFSTRVFSFLHTLILNTKAKDEEKTETIENVFKLLIEHLLSHTYN